MKILIADKFEQVGIDGLAALGCDVRLQPELKDDALKSELTAHPYDILIVRSTKLPRETLEAAADLKLVIRAGSGYDTIDYRSAAEMGIHVCNCPGMNAVAVAELTLGLMIALDRRIVDETDDLRRGVWNKKEYSRARGLKGRTLGMIGLGRIGYEVAKRAKAFEMELIYTDPIRRPDVEAELNIQPVSFDDLLSRADFITLHVPGGKDTHHLINAETLAKMKPTAFIINCSRGGIVDECALAEALEADRIGGAAFDVYEIEPAATDHEFKDPIPKAPHVYGTHHVGASTEQAQLAVAEETVRIVRTFMKEGRFLNCVNEPRTAAEA